MVRRLPAILIGALCVTSGSARCDDLTIADGNAQAELLTVSHSTPWFAGRWCISTFIDQSRKPGAAQATRYRSPVYRFVSEPAYSLAGAHPAYDTEPPLVSRLKALRTLRMMTLWQGRESALVFGLNESGYIGIRLDEALAHAD